MNLFQNELSSLFGIFVFKPFYNSVELRVYAVDHVVSRDPHQSHDADEDELHSTPLTETPLKFFRHEFIYQG